MSNKFCCRCQEDFPLATEPARWQMGELRELQRASKKIKDEYAESLDNDDFKYLCGNCFFDLTDE